LRTSGWPEPLVFDMHLHDLWEVPSYQGLRRPWRWIYARDRSRGLGNLERFLQVLARAGYTLSTLGRVCREFGETDVGRAQPFSRTVGEGSGARLGSGRRPSTDANSSS
jgi:hypothetical protein